MDKILAELESIHETEDMSESIETMKEKINQNTELNEERIDLINNIYTLQKLCLFYEDLSNKNEDVVNISLINAAYNDLSEPTDDFNRFARFISQNKRELLNYNGIERYIQILQNDVQRLNNQIINSEEGRILNVNFIK